MLCDAHYMPVKEICVEHAVYLLMTGKASPLHLAEGLVPVARLGLAESAVANWGPKLDGLIEDGKFLVPTAIRLHRAIAYRLASLRPSRHLVFKRDKHTCQYCGRRAGPLTLDHVMPASRGGEDTWENLVAACGACNQFKANRTPEEAGMRLASQPRRYVASFNWEFMDKLCLA
jgi:hypothetical protein